MREIKFRGFWEIQKRWVYGNLIVDENGTNSHFSLECADCYNSDSEGECLRKSDVEYCDAGHVEWWHEVVSLGQFRKDVGLE